MLWRYKHSVHLLNSLVFCTCSSRSLCLSAITSFFGRPSSSRALHVCTAMIDRPDFVLDWLIAYQTIRPKPNRTYSAP